MAGFWVLGLGIGALVGAVETRVQWEAWFEALRGLAPLDSQVGGLCGRRRCRSGPRSRNRHVPGGGIRSECGLVGRCSDHPVSLDLGFKEDAIDAGRTVVIHGEGGVDGTEEVHIEVVITMRGGTRSAKCLLADSLH